MDDFREWLSDNLRYFMLGGAILLIVAVLFFSIRACSGSKKGNSGNDQNTTAQDGQGNDPSSPTEDGETDDGKKEDANPMENANADISALIKSYYKALGEKDIATLRTLVDDLSPTDESRIINAEYIEGYEVGDVYTKKGLTEGSYVVYACFNYICSGITTPVPALSSLYVATNNEGNLKIDCGADQDAQISAYIASLESHQDVQALYSKVKEDNEQAQQEDEALADFLAGLGEDAGSSTSAANGTVLTVTEGCNVRAEASTEGDIIGGYEAGEQVEKKGESGEWIEIEYEGQTGYIHSSLLE